jgi:L-alanine-DL-glutamate epimerase-like enolase superfamily enzyme
MGVVSRMDVFGVDHGTSLRWTEAAPVCNLTTTILRVTDDDGAQGIAGYDSYMPAPSDRSVLEALRSLAPALLGRDSGAREALADDVRVAVVFPQATVPVAMIDTALWDLEARRADAPLSYLLGSARREQIPAYASLTTMATEDEYVATVARACDEGLGAVKVHAWGEPQRDIRLLERLRAEHPDLTIMHDAEGVYDRDGALRVGHALEEIGARWFEAPLPDFDLDGYRGLRRRLDVPVLAAGYAMWDPLQIAEALRDPPWSAVRAELTCTLGVTALCRIAQLAGAFGLDFEPVSYGHTLLQAANLQVMLAFDNIRYFELPYPAEPWEYGVVTPIRPGPDGTVALPDGPGLGVELDWGWVEQNAFARISLPA